MNIITNEEIEELPLPTLGEEVRIEKSKVRGRGGFENIPQLTREIIAVHTNLGAPQNLVADAEGISAAVVSNISRGVNNTNLDNQKIQPDIKAIGLQAKHKIIDLATTKLMDSLNLFNPNAIEQKELPGAAAKLASVAEKLTGNSVGITNNIQFVIYQPKPKTESDFGDVIDLNER